MYNPNDKNAHKIEGIFSTPLYRAVRNSSLNPTEEAELEDIIKDGSRANNDRESSNEFSNDSYIFETKLVDLKEFCERHIKIYVKEVLGIQKEELTFYITQSWLSITQPGKRHNLHWHQNSLISGVFYTSVEVDDYIAFYDPNYVKKNMLLLNRDENQAWNSDMYMVKANNNELLLFPSWLDHGIVPNKWTTMDRISLSFNVFVRGSLGVQGELNELILK